MAEPLLRFVQISDTHISADPHYNTDGAQHTPLIGAQALVHQINALPFAPDFVLHTGDVAYNPDESAYATAREILSAIRYPMYYLAGNHDDPAMIRRILLGQDAAGTPLDYEFEVNGVQVICLDSNRPAAPWLGKFSDAQMAWLDGLCRADDARPLIVALHHPVLPMGAPFWDNQMCMIDAEAIHRTLLQARGRLRGVFAGHVHQNTDIVRDGIAYFTGLSSWYQAHTYPDQRESEPDRFAEPGFSVVVVTRDQIFVRRHRFMVDPGSLVE